MDRLSDQVGPAVTYGVLVTAVVVAGTGVLLGVARWMIPGETKQSHHEVIIAIHQMVGMLYAILLAFVVIIVWEAASKANDDSQIEANKVSQIYFTARGLPEPQNEQLARLAHDYAATVARQEWRLMREGGTSHRARVLVARMRVVTHSLTPGTPREEILMTQTLDAINALVDARRERTSAVQSPVPPVMWIGLIGGAVITIGFTFLYDYTRYLPHFLAVSTMAALVTFMLWLVWEMSSPFDGPTGVGPTAFDQILQRFKEFS